MLKDLQVEEKGLEEVSFEPPKLPKRARLQPWQRTLLKAADAIETFGWRKEWYGSVNSGFCAIGALRHVARDYAGAARALAQHLRVNDQADVTAWNDAKGRSKRQVIAALRAAAKG